MLTIIVTAEVVCDRCGFKDLKRLRDGSARKLVRAARRALIRDGWQLASRSRFSSRTENLCPSCVRGGPVVAVQDEAALLGRVGLGRGVDAT